MRIFEVLLGFEWVDQDQLMAVYVPGLRYTCRDGDDALSTALDAWVRDGRVKLVEESSGTGPSNLGGIGEVA